MFIVLILAVWAVTKQFLSTVITRLQGFWYPTRRQFQVGMSATCLLIRDVVLS